MNEEIWKDIKEYEGIYQISNFGRVKSLYRTIKGRWGETIVKQKILKPVKDKDGYLIVTLCNNGNQRTHRIHRLVAVAFLDNINNFPFINHKDENKQNNCVDNLEWCTAKYNTNYGSSIKRRAEKCRKKVAQFDLKGNLIATYNSTIDAYNKTNIYHIYDCCNKKLKTCGGYVWRYINEE